MLTDPAFWLLFLKVYLIMSLAALIGFTVGRAHERKRIGVQMRRNVGRLYGRDQ